MTTIFDERSRLINSTGNTAVDPATSNKQDDLITELEKKADLTETQPVSVASLPLPSGASTSDNQTNGNQKTQVVDSSNTTIFGNRTASGTIDANGESVSIAFTGEQSAAVLISGTWSGTMVVEGSIDGSTYGTVWVSTVNQSPVALGIPTPSNSITSNGTYKIFQTSGFTSYRIRSTSWSSGSASITWSTVYAPSSFIYTAGAIIQQVANDSNNSSTDNLTSGSTYTGTAQNTLGVNAAQINLKTDQNCTVYVDQSIDGTNWDIVDSFNYYYSLGGNSWTVQMTGSYYRIRVTNNGASTTTYFRLQTNLCPIVECLPRSLSSDGDLKTEINCLKDCQGFPVGNTPNEEMKVITPYRLVGASFIGTTLDTNFWTASTGTGGSASIASGQLTISTGTTADNVVSVASNRSARYIGGSANRFRCVLQAPDTGVADNTRRWGAFTSTDGCFFQITGTTFSIVTRKASNDTVVSNGSFNGTITGSSITVTTGVHIYEIEWNNSRVYFFRDSILIHTVTATDATWTSTLTLPVRIENFNTGGSTTNVLLYIRSSVISRLGKESTQPTSKYQSGTTAGLVLKYGAGNLHGIVISGVANNSNVTLYDNTAASGTVLWSSGAMGAQTIPFPVPFWNKPFSTGLTLVIANANCNVDVVYE